MIDKAKTRKEQQHIPEVTINRLSIYRRCLELLTETQRGQYMTTISSPEISEITGINPNQIRKDLSYFGEFGKRGIGYPIKELLNQLKGILKSSEKWDVILVGAGKIGKALLRYRGFKKRGFHIKAVFDNKKTKIGQSIDSIKIYDVKDIKNYINKWNIKIGIVTVPAQSAQEVVDIMVAGGIKSILNMAPVCVKHPRDVIVNNIDLSIELERLVYYLSSNDVCVRE